MDAFDQENLGSSSSSQEDNINVVVRVRPLCEKERRNRDDMVAQFPGNGQILVIIDKFDEHKKLITEIPFNFPIV